MSAGTEHGRWVCYCWRIGISLDNVSIMSRSHLDKMKRKEKILLGIIFALYAVAAAMCIVFPIIYAIIK